MGRYKTAKYTSLEETFCPSTKMGSLVNVSPASFGSTWGLLGAAISPVSIGLGVEVSAFFFLGIGLWLISGIWLLAWLLNSYKMDGNTFNKNVLQVEQAYARLSSRRKKQYKPLVEQSYRNALVNKSSSAIQELFEKWAEIDDLGSKYVEDELKLVKQVNADMREMERQLNA